MFLRSLYLPDMVNCINWFFNVFRGVVRLGLIIFCVIRVQRDEFMGVPMEGFSFFLLWDQVLTLKFD